jgi:hypothetical protein
MGGPQFGKSSTVQNFWSRTIAKVEHMSTCFQAGLFPFALSAGDAPGHPHGA